MGHWIQAGCSCSEEQPRAVLLLQGPDKGPGVTQGLTLTWSLVIFQHQDFSTEPGRAPGTAGSNFSTFLSGFPGTDPLTGPEQGLCMHQFQVPTCCRELCPTWGGNHSNPGLSHSSSNISVHFHLFLLHLFNA